MLITSALTVFPFSGELSGGPAELKAHVLDYASRVYEEAKLRIGHHYPTASNGDVPIAWRWARTASSPDPAFADRRTPIVADWWLAKGKEPRWIEPIEEGAKLRFDVASRQRAGRIGPSPSLKKMRCVWSGAPLTFEYLKREGHGDGFTPVLLATITYGDARGYLAPDAEQERAALTAVPQDPPTLALPGEGLGLRVQAYGLKRWADLYTSRQLLAMETFSSVVGEIGEWARADGLDKAAVDGVTAVLALCVGKMAQFNSSLALWKIDSRNGVGKAESAFGRSDVPMTWDFVETNPFGGSVGDWMQIVRTALLAFDQIVPEAKPAFVHQLDARAVSMHMPKNSLVATDPPYFDNIGYADLSDYFYVWIRRALKSEQPALTATLGAPREGELIADSSRHNGSEEAAKAYFTEGFVEVFKSLAEASSSHLPLLIVYAFKQQESQSDGHISSGWEAMLEAVLESGLGIAGTWPIHGTGSTRQRSQASNVLASYVLLVCRPRAIDAPMGTVTEFRNALRATLRTAIPTFHAAAIAPVDLAQAAIGPGMATFSHYSGILQADGARMKVRTALAMINQAVDEIMAEQEGDFDSDTRFALTWFEQRGFDDGPYGEADVLARAKNTSADGLRAAGILWSRAGRARLLRRSELSNEWDPTTDERPTVWEGAQHLTHQLELGGEEAAARLLRRLGGGLGETARELAYRLFAICERKGWVQDALAYNALVVAWPEIARLVAGTPEAQAQQALEV